MKLTTKDVHPRIVIKLDKSIRVDGGVMKFGEKDNYPNLIERIIAGSVTAQAVSDIYAKFIIGQGFVEPGLNEFVVSYDARGKEVTMLDLLRQAAMSVAVNNGLYIHSRVNVLGQRKDHQIFPFKICRFTKVDDRGYTNSITVNKNYGEKDFKKTENVTYDVFTSNPQALLSLFKEYDNIDSYPGQIYFHFWDNRFLYPLSPFDSVYLDADTENQISLYQNRELRNGFMLTHLLRVAEFTSEEEKEQFIRMIQNAEGANGTRIITLEDEYDEDTGSLKESGAFNIQKIETNINDKLFENWEKSIPNKIRKANKALPAILIDYENSKLGNTSGEAIIQATNYYNAMTNDDRMQMSRVFRENFSNHVDPIVSGVTDWAIKPLNFINNVS